MLWRPPGARTVNGVQQGAYVAPHRARTVTEVYLDIPCENALNTTCDVKVLDCLPTTPWDSAHPGMLGMGLAVAQYLLRTYRGQ